jgi:hypothetical protein
VGGDVDFFPVAFVQDRSSQEATEMVDGRWTQSKSRAVALSGAAHDAWIMDDGCMHAYLTD